MESAGIINEVWCSVSGFPNYQISNIGRIRRTETGIILSPYNHSEYMRINLITGGNLKRMYIHRLVAMEFIENPLYKPKVDHINGDKTNNCVHNLRWAFDDDDVIRSFLIITDSVGFVSRSSSSSSSSSFSR